MKKGILKFLLKLSKVLCKFYTKTGNCSKGLTCKFIHDTNSLPKCKFFEQGSCLKQDCPFQHIKPNQVGTSFFLQDIEKEKKEIYQITPNFLNKI